MNKTVLRPLILIFLVNLLAWPLFAQFGNEWIHFNQQYFKISVAKDGLYRLSYADLQAAGFPSNADYQRIQLFHRGVEQRINIVKANLGVSQLQPGDYLEFYGLKNTGVSDTALYKTGTQPHPYYNLYSDSSHYFLTFNTGLELGKRIDTFSEVNVTNIPAEVSHTDEKLTIFATEYSQGIRYGSFTENSLFETGEGWTGDQIVNGGFSDFQFQNLTNGATSSGFPQIEIQLAGRAELLHRADVSVGPVAPTHLVATGDFTNFNVLTLTGTLNWSDIGSDGKMVVRVQALGVNGASDRLSVSYIKITYPQSFNQTGGAEKVFLLNANVGNKSYIEIQNAPVGTRLFDITDPANVLKIGTTSTTTLNAVVPSTATQRKLLATTNSTIPIIKKVSFRNIDPSTVDYIIISHPALMKPSGSFSNPVKAYADYRASAEGGSYDTLIADILQLYDQFNYGEVSALAVYRFMKFMVNSGSPRYLFIIGKGLDLNQDMGLKLGGYYRNPSAFTFHDYVPSAGIPSSDALFTAGLNGSTYEPSVPTGRITASTPNDVDAYLNKVKEAESLAYDDLWRKRLLHLSGGINPGEPELFKSYLSEFAEIAEDFYLGGKVSVKSKTSTDLESININSEINDGVNLVTLFGHSSSQQNDFNIGFVSAPELEYNNPGKYPMFLINGCNAGEFLTTTTRYGEDWINTPGKGAIGFMANTFFGNSGVLRAYSKNFYEVAYGDSVFIHKGIGDIQKETFRRLLQISPTIGFIAQGQQMFLLGDPAVKLFGASKPDYEINDDYVYAESFDDNPITAASDSFAIKLIVRNFGRAKEDPITVRVERQLSDNTTIAFDTLFSPVLYRDTLTLKIYKADKGFGNNIFHITVDPFNDINEIVETNNEADLNLFIPLSASRNLYPQKFSIVNSASVQLVFQSTDVLGDARDFIIELDTVDTFDSPIVQQFSVHGKIATQTVDLITSVDTLAYYWRTRFTQKLNEGESDDWSMSSFTFITNGPEGWAQVHFPQYMSNATSGLEKDPDARLLRLEETINDFSIKTFGVNHDGYLFHAASGKTYHPELSVKIGGTEYHPISLISVSPQISCRKNTINLLAFDRTTTIPYTPIAVQFPDTRACGRRPEVITSFSSTQVDLGDGKDLIQCIDNIQPGDSVVLFTLGDPGYASWTANAKSKLADIGISAAQMAAVQPGEPIVILAKKGVPAGSALIIKSLLAPADEQELETSGTITGKNVSGTMTSSLIGPAVEWESLETKSDNSEPSDEFSFDVVGVSLSGTKTVLKPGLQSPIVDLSDIDAEQYPYLQLVYHTGDEINQTPPQLNKWLVVYTPAPEGVITFDGDVTVQNLKEGEIWTGTYGFHNISEKTFSDSLTVQYNIYNNTLRTSEIKTKKIKAPAPGEETEFSITVDTREKGGLNNVKVYANPKILPELYYDNNIIDLNKYLNVEPDLFNPVLDVTIDSRYILNGDFVSSSPSIVAKLWDENSLLPKTDTLGITISLKYPCESCQSTPIFFSRADMQWQSATSTTDFTFEFNPQNLIPGTYTLLIIARDTRNNSSGEVPYEVTFNVAEDNVIIVQPPFPNPSGSNFNFTVVVTGDDKPDHLTLEIINTRGQVVFNGTYNEFFTGTNRIPWNATELPGGLYIYRLNVMRNGKVQESLSGRLSFIPQAR